MGNYVLGAIVGVLVIALLATMFLLMLPGITANHFYSACDMSFNELTSKGHLTPSEESALMNALYNKGFSNITVNVTSGNWNEPVVLEVKATLTYNLILGQTRTIPIRYHQESINMAKR